MTALNSTILEAADEIVSINIEGLDTNVSLEEAIE